VFPPKIKPPYGGFVFGLGRGTKNPKQGFEPPQKGGRVRRLRIAQFCKVGAANPCVPTKN